MDHGGLHFHQIYFLFIDQFEMDSPKTTVKDQISAFKATAWSFSWRTKMPFHDLLKQTRALATAQTIFTRLFLVSVTVAKG